MNLHHEQDKDARMTWADCVAALKAGVNASSLLPALDGLASSASASRDMGAEKIPPTARLYQRAPDHPSHIFQMVYLRPPFALWDYVENNSLSAEVGASSCEAVDGEFDLDILGMFQPRFIDAPVFSSPKGVEGAQTGPISSPACGSFDHIAHPTAAYSISRTGCDAHDDAAYVVSNDQLLLLADKLAEHLSSDHEAGVEEIPTSACHMSRWQWSVVYCMLSDRMHMNAGRALRLLRAVDVPFPLAEFVLLGALPTLMSVDDGDASGDGLQELVHVVSRSCRAGGWTSARLRQLMDAGALGGGTLRSVKSEMAIASLCREFM
jgi:hypothetical protein